MALKRGYRTLTLAGSQPQLRGRLPVHVFEQDDCVSHPTIRSLGPDFVPFQADDVGPIATVQPAAPVQPMGILVMLRAD